jgi:hypothetical protein
MRDITRVNNSNETEMSSNKDSQIRDLPNTSIVKQQSSNDECSLSMHRNFYRSCRSPTKTARSKNRSGRAFNFIGFWVDLQVAARHTQRDSACDLNCFSAPTFRRGEKDIQAMPRYQPLFHARSKNIRGAVLSVPFPTMKVPVTRGSACTP